MTKIEEFAKSINRPILNFKGRQVIVVNKTNKPVNIPDGFNVYDIRHDLLNMPISVEPLVCVSLWGHIICEDDLSELSIAGCTGCWQIPLSRQYSIRVINNILS